MGQYTLLWPTRPSVLIYLSSDIEAGILTMVQAVGNAKWTAYPEASLSHLLDDYGQGQVLKHGSYLGFIILFLTLDEACTSHLRISIWEAKVFSQRLAPTRLLDSRDCRWHPGAVAV